MSTFSSRGYQKVWVLIAERTSLEEKYKKMMTNRTLEAVKLRVRNTKLNKDLESKEDRIKSWKEESKAHQKI